MLRGIISWRGERPVRAAMLSTTGMKMATTPVELITAPSDATDSMSSTMSRGVLRPACADSQSPSR